MLGRYLANPGRDHWVAVKKVLWYLKRTRDNTLLYKRVDDLEVIGYANVDLARYQDDKKSTSRFIFLRGGGAISWRSVKQSLVASSTMQAEDIACYEAGAHTKWLKNFIYGLKVVESVSRPIKILCDNSSTVSFARNLKNSRGA